MTAKFTTSWTLRVFRSRLSIAKREQNKAGE